MNIQYVSHACLKITSSNNTLITDPWILNYPVKATSVWKFPKIKMDTEEILDSVDYVYISHSHEDHFHIPSINLFPRETKLIIPTFKKDSLKRDKLIFNVLSAMGFKNIIELTPWENFKINQNFKCTLVPAAKSRYYDWENSGLILSSKKSNILNLNDNVPDKELSNDIKERFNKIDIAFIQTAGISTFPSCFEMKKSEKKKKIKEKVIDYSIQDLVMDIIQPNYVIPFAGDFGWFHSFQTDHNKYARLTPTSLYDHIEAKGFNCVPMEPGETFSISYGHIKNKERINWNEYDVLIGKSLFENKKKIKAYNDWLMNSDTKNLRENSLKRIGLIQEFYSNHKMEMTASIAYFINGKNSNFSIIINSKSGFPIQLSIENGKCNKTDQTYTLPEFVWASIIDGKILWNNIQWLTTIKENKKFNNEIRDLIFWLGYYIDLGSRNPEVLIHGEILGKKGTHLRLDLNPNNLYE